MLGQSVMLEYSKENYWVIFSCNTGFYTEQGCSWLKPKCVPSQTEAVCNYFQAVLIVFFFLFEHFKSGILKIFTMGIQASHDYNGNEKATKQKV